MVQDLQIINEAVVPLHPTVPNPYVILGEIPPICIVSLHLMTTALLCWNTVPGRSAMSAGQMMHKEVTCSQIKLLWFRYFLSQQRLAEAL